MHVHVGLVLGLVIGANLQICTCVWQAKCMYVSLSSQTQSFPILRLFQIFLFKFGNSMNGINE